MLASSYEIIAQAQGSVGEKPLRIGNSGYCRFCGTNDKRKFRHVAHSLPEALGNKWIVSLDECDECNHRFSRYDDALAKSVGPILTVGGTPGKNNNVRQTGRTGGPSVIKHSKHDGKRRISMSAHTDNFGDNIQFDPINRIMRMTTPVAKERFIPRFAFKALAKTGLALLPDQEVSNFDVLRAWVCDTEEEQMIVELPVGISFGSVGNAPPLAAVALLKRIAQAQMGPEMIFLISVGSVCFQIAMQSDKAVDNKAQDKASLTRIRWTNVLCPPDHDELRIEYGMPTHLNWAATSLELTPLEKIMTAVNIQTSQGQITPIFRKGAPIMQ